MTEIPKWDTEFETSKQQAIASLREAAAALSKVVHIELLRSLDKTGDPQRASQSHDVQQYYNMICHVRGFIEVLSRPNVVKTELCGGLENLPINQKMLQGEMKYLPS